MKLRSPRCGTPAPVLLAVALGLASLAMQGCVIGGDDDDGHHMIVEERAYYTWVTTDYVLGTTLGEGAGVFVEYSAFGLWTVWTSCDTAFSDTICGYDVLIRSTAPVAAWNELELEGADYVESFGGGDLTMVVDTDYDRDVVAFSTDPGAPVEMELVIDGVNDPSYFVWHGEGTLHSAVNGTGAPASPVVFQPDVP